MSEAPKFIQKVQPLYTDTLGSVIPAPFQSIPFTELFAYVTQANVLIGGTAQIDMAALMTATQDLYIVGYAWEILDAANLGYRMQEGMYAFFSYTVAAVVYSPIRKFYDISKLGTFADAGNRANHSIRFPMIKVPYNQTAAVFHLINRTAQVLDNIFLWVFYFTLPYAR